MGRIGLGVSRIMTLNLIPKISTCCEQSDLPSRLPAPGALGSLHPTPQTAVVFESYHEAPRAKMSGARLGLGSRYGGLRKHPIPWPP